MFIGREKELSVMEKLYSSGKFEFLVLYGRRRVGKTALINRFAKDKGTVFFTGVESNSKQNLENLSRCIFEYEDPAGAELSFLSFQSALDHVFRLSLKERLIFVIDEYPYVARSYQSFSSTLQMLIDKYKDGSKLMLVLCGSSMSYMEDHVLAYKAPLYGRRTAQIKLEPFGFDETCKCLSGFSGADKAVAYGLAGGTPQYILQFDGKLSIEENIKNTFLNPSSFIYEEPVNLLKQEVREPAIYTAVISAIASGASRLSEIAGKVGETTGVCSVYIKNLMGLGIIKKETPYGEKPSRRTIYSISDNMFRFWYRIVPGNSSLIERGAADLVYERIRPSVPDHMGKVFEDICMQYLWKLLLSGRSPVFFSSLGRWWGGDPKTKKQLEIDIMGEENKDTALFAECKWTGEKADLGVLEQLMERCAHFPHGKKHYFLFSRSGFTKGCADAAAASGNVTLVTYDEMLK